jgi:hypothetical protein
MRMNGSVRILVEAIDAPPAPTRHGSGQRQTPDRHDFRPGFALDRAPNQSDLEINAAIG